MATSLLDVLHALGAAAGTTLWIPALAWTLGSVLLLVLLRLQRGLHPLAAYAAARAFLYALPAGLLLAAFTDWFVVPLAMIPAPSQGPLAAPHLAPVSPVRPGGPALDAFHALGVLTLLSAAVSVVALLRLVADGIALRRLHRSLPTHEPAALVLAGLSCAGRLGLRRPVRVVATGASVVPFTYGLRRPVVVVPEALVEEPEALRMALLHELVHVRRGDFAAHAAERFLGALFAPLPTVAPLRREVERLRESTCDHRVLACPSVDRRAYADLLLRFLAPAPRLGLGLSAPADHFKRRLHAMKDSARVNRFTHPRLVSGLVVVLVLVTSAVGVAALTDAFAPPSRPVVTESPVLAPAPPPPVARQTPDASGAEVFVIVEDPPDLIGGIAGIQERIRYPEVARLAGIEGMVVVQFVVDEEGRVLAPQVLRGPGGGLGEEALRVVSEARFEPGRQRGRPVKVKMSLPVRFKLGTERNEPAAVEQT